MSRMVGLELMVIGRKRHFELRREAGGYVDGRGKPISGLLDMSCYVCGSGYYTLEDEPIGFCPACGFIERDAPKSAAEFVTWAQQQDWSYLDAVDRQAFAASTPRGWLLKFARSADDLYRTGQFSELKRLWPPSGR